jgi:rhodanese-related sulfurtransferase
MRHPLPDIARAWKLGTLLALTLLAPIALEAVEMQESEQLQVFTPYEVVEILRSGKGPVIIDARHAGQYAEGHVPGALNVWHKDTYGRLPELRRFEERGIIYYCTKGHQSKTAGRRLLGEHFRRVGVMAGHFEAWQELGLPVER